MTLSIIIPVYNAGKWLERMFNLLEEQCFLGNNCQETEVLLIDDGSKDNSKEIIQRAILSYSNIRYFYQENSGPHIARNLGIRQAKGKYIVFLDSDDAYTKNAIPLLLKTAEMYDAEIVRGGFIMCDENAFMKWKSYDNSKISDVIEESGVEFILRNNGLHYIGNVWGVLYRRSFIIENNLYFDERIRYYEDYAYNWLIFPECKKVVSISNVVYHWMQREGSLCHTYERSHRVINEVESAKQSAFLLRELWSKYREKKNFPTEISNIMLRVSFWNTYKYLGSLIKFQCLHRNDISLKILQLKEKGVYPYPHRFPKHLPNGYPKTLRYKIMWSIMSYEWLLKLLLVIFSRKKHF